MQITRIYADEHGITHFAELEIALHPHGVIGQLSDLYPLKGVIFRETPPSYDNQWHTAPRKQFVVNLNGSVQVTVGDGESRIFGEGSVFLLEDTSGQGHTTRTLLPVLRRSLFLVIE
jgi:hypothetical protein